MIFYKTLYRQLLLILLLVMIMTVTLSGSLDVEKPAYSYQNITESAGIPDSDILKYDPLMDLLGITFDEIKQVLGKPDEQGHSFWFGPHNYILYQNEEGFIRFCSPAGIEEFIAISIIIGPGQEVYGAQAGMLFTEIMAILGPPDLGPELGPSNLYYMDYYLGELSNQVPEVFISFSSVDINSPTHKIFIKWEAYGYSQKNQQQAAR